MSNLSVFHPSIQRAVGRHREFFDGRRRFLVKVHVPVAVEGLPKQIPFDEMDWEKDFDRYVQVGVVNGIAQAAARLELGIDDDTIPCYHPYFGISIHHSFFGGKVTHGGGTSWAEPVIDRAADWPRLRYDLANSWIEKLARGLAWCRDHGQGVLAAGYRGGNGPLDMANGVMGNSLYTEFSDDPGNLAKVVDICLESILGTFGLQRANNTEIDGGHIVPMGGLWVPGGMIGHVSLDAACLAGPAVYERWEKPYMEQLARRTGGMVVHTHMLGRKCFSAMCRTEGVRVFAPVDDPNQPALLDVLDDVLAVAGDTPLMLSVAPSRFDEVLPKFQGRRAVVCFSAASADEAKGLLQRFDHYCPLER